MPEFPNHPTEDGVRLTAPSGRSWVVFLSLGLATLLGAGLWVLIARPFLQRQAMPDGSLMTLESVTEGKTHTFLKVHGWGAALGAVLPSAAQQRLGGQLIRHEGEREAVVFWITRRLKEPGRYFQIRRVTLVDAAGREAEGPVRSVHNDVRPDQTSMAWEVPVFPAERDTFRLRLYLRDMRTNQPHQVEFSAAAPVLSRPKPAGVAPHPLPETVSRGDVAFTLTGLRTGVQEKDWDRPAAADEPHYTVATYRITRGGRPVRGWRPISVRLEDGAGNRHTPDKVLHDPEDEVLRLAFRGHLWPESGAWRLRVELRQDPSRHPEARWALRGLPLPGSGETAPASQVTERWGLQLRALGIGAPGTMLPEGGPSFAEHPTLHVRISPPEAPLLLSLAGAVDDRGWSALPPGRQPYTDPVAAEEGFAALPLAPLPGARRVTVTLGLHRTETVEFTVPAPRL